MTTNDEVIAPEAKEEINNVAQASQIVHVTPITETISHKLNQLLATIYKILIAKYHDHFDVYV